LKQKVEVREKKLFMPQFILIKVIIIIYTMRLET